MDVMDVGNSPLMVGMAAICVASILWVIQRGMVFVRTLQAANMAENAAVSRHNAAIASRADAQHAAYLAGDETGIYGDYPPANYDTEADR